MGPDSGQVLLFTAIYGLIKVASVFLYTMVLTDRFGRRPLLLFGTLINLCCLTYLAAFLGLSHVTATSGPSSSSWVAIVSICLFAVGKSNLKHAALNYTFDASPQVMASVGLQPSPSPLLRSALPVLAVLSSRLHSHIRTCSTLVSLVVSPT